jgi:hypothetical protein
MDRDLIYLLQLTRKHHLTPTILHATMLAARDRGNARHGKFSIELRHRGESSSTYMFSVEGKPLAQAEIPNESVEKLKRLPDEFLPFDQNENDSSKLNAQGERRISDLKFGLRSVSFKAHVVKKSEVRAVTSKDGNPLLVCDVTLSDGTGEIPLAVWNSQITSISEGDFVRIQDANVRSFRGEIQLYLRRKTGTLTVLQRAIKPQLAAISN